MWVIVAEPIREIQRGRGELARLDVSGFHHVVEGFAIESDFDQNHPNAWNVGDAVEDELGGRLHGWFQSMNAPLNSEMS